MQSLRELQAGFQAGILEQRLPPTLAIAEKSPRPERFANYIDGYRIRLAGALRANYPVLHKLLGDRAFDELARRFIERQPSSSRSIRWFGSELEEFVRGSPDVLPHPALLDIVSMEWAISRAFDAPDERPATVEDLKAVPADLWHSLRFALHASVSIVPLNWSVEPLIRIAQEAGEGDFEEPVAFGHTAIVWRRGLQPNWRALDPQEAHCLRMLDSRSTFGEMCATLAEDSDTGTAAHVASRYVAQWISVELLVLEPSAEGTSRWAQLCQKKPF
ncbi:MAG TPA: DNA-binding domain-containing protein [Burkholderiaceae bacterium]|nr:DNA-binding domain-containing protein [Burkholderiaceae bacterium]